MTNRKNLKKILSNTQDLNDFLAFSQEQIDYVESDNESSQGENQAYTGPASGFFNQKNDKFLKIDYLEEVESSQSSQDASETNADNFNLTTETGFINAVKKEMRKVQKTRYRTPNTQTRQQKAQRERRSERQRQLRDILSKDSVVVFSREAFKPWDDIPRFDFLDCNLKQVMKEGEERERTKVSFKDSFIGNIN